jgi:hypothetical protein
MATNYEVSAQRITLENIIFQTLINWSVGSFEANRTTLEQISVQDLIDLSGISATNLLMGDVILDLRQRELIGPRTRSDQFHAADETLTYVLEDIHRQLEENVGGFMPFNEL